MAAFQSGGGLFDQGGVSHNPIQNLDAVIARLGIGQQQNMQVQQRTPINELDDIFAELTQEQRKVVETNEEYNVALGNVLQKFIFYLLTKTPEGYSFVAGPGKKYTQGLLDVTKKITDNIDDMVKNDFKDMQARMAQLESIIVQQNERSQQQDAKIAEQESQLMNFKKSLGDN
jgi:hypothetical protein